MELDRAIASRISQFTCPIAAQVVRISQSYHPNIKQSYQAQPYCIPCTTFTNSHTHIHTHLFTYTNPPYIPNNRWQPPATSRPRLLQPHPVKSIVRKHGFGTVAVSTRWFHIRRRCVNTEDSARLFVIWDWENASAGDVEGGSFAKGGDGSRE